MNKTFTRETIDGRQYQFLTLPGSNLFKFEIINKMGAHVERAVYDITGRNVFGLSHLVEHLGFRCCKDYTTDELMQALKKEGTYNASTDHERINYWFKTTSSRMRTAIRLVLNYGLNDLSLLTDEEFQTEKKTVYNEVKRYNDDDQTMFHFSVMPAFCGYDTEHDNILGTPESVDATTLEDAQMIKAIFLTQGDMVFNITYDPTVLTKEEITATVDAELSRFPAPDSTELCNHIGKAYRDYISEPTMLDTTIDNPSEQVMTALLFDTMGDINVVAARVGNRYLSSLSPISMTDLIREKNGLTYSLWLYDDQMAYKPYAVFGCDVTRGTEERMMELLEQAVDESVDRFDRDAYEDLMDMITLKRTLAFVDQEQYDRIFWTALWHPQVIDVAAEEFADDIDSGYRALDRRLSSYDNVKAYIEMFRHWVKNKKYGKLTNLEN